MILVCPVSLQSRAAKEELQLSFRGCPAYDALVDRIEQASTALDLEQVNFCVRRGAEDIDKHNWELLTIGLAAINLMVIQSHAVLVTNQSN